MVKLLILADDFTGGLDTGVQFASRGIPTCVVTDPTADCDAASETCEVLVLVAETRHLAPEAAYDVVFSAVEKAAARGIPYIYKKTDSALRGNIGAELTAALKASGADVLPFLPALPANGRITRGGVHFVDSVPVADSPFGKDPFEPVRESDVARLIRLQSDSPVWNGSADSIPGQNGIWVFDAQTEEDLAAAGRQLAQRGLLRVCAGCAGFAGHLPELLGLTADEAPGMPELDDGLFVLCGSVNPISRRQLAWAETHGFERLHIRPEQKLTPGYFSTEAGRAALREWQTAGERAPWLILDANDADGRNAESAAYAAARGMTTEDVRRTISGALGDILQHMLEGSAARTTLIIGGDTLLQCMNRMGVYRMKPLLEIYPGVVLSCFRYGSETRHVITKSGGFGRETLLTDLRELLDNSKAGHSAIS